MAKFRKRASRAGENKRGRVNTHQESHVSAEAVENDDTVSSASDSELIRDLNRSKNRKNRKTAEKGWQAMGLDHAVLKGISKKGYRRPTEIQRKAIPPVLDGKDVVGMSRTGSGKTAAFVIPMLNRLKQRDTRGARALLISPTRELALQTFRVVKELGRFTGLRCACLVGGDSIEEQFAALHENPDIVLATPGRLLHVVVEMDLKLSSIQYLVFDEADRLFEMGFSEQLHEILKRMPESKQVLLFSATLPKVLVDFAKAGLTEPTLVRLDVESKLSKDLRLVFGLCQATEKLSALIATCRAVLRKGEKIIVFCATMKHVEYVVSVLKEAGLECSFLYSQLDPVARKENIAKFHRGESNLLIVTDIAARGVDIPLLDTAINLHFPPKPKLFVHRVGRVARAGRSGTSISLITPDELPYLIDLLLFLGKPMQFHSTGQSVHGDGGANEIDHQPRVGRFPEDVAHQETEFLIHSHNASLEVSELRTKSENAMQKYKRTIPQPSAESVRRAKKEFRSVVPAIHPYFTELLTSPTGAEPTECKQLSINQNNRDNLLEKLRSWRPQATILEIHSSAKESTAGVMKAKRLEHQKRIEKQRSHAASLDFGVIPEEEVRNEVSAAGQVVSIVPWSGNDETNGGSPRRKRKGLIPASPMDSQKALKELRRREEKEEYFVSYRPQDQHSESTLAVERNRFDEMARQVSMDIVADDDVGMHEEKRKKHWDRRLKKFVGPGDENHKVRRMIRTEEGTRLPASYKSGRYADWQHRQKLQSYGDALDGQEPGESSGGLTTSMQRMRRNHPGGKKPGKAAAAKNELRNTDQIRKIRRVKARKSATEQRRREQRVERRTNKSAGGGFRKFRK